MSDSKTLELSPSVFIIMAGIIIAGAIIYTRTLPPAQALQQGVQAPATSANVRAPSAADHIVGSLSAPVVLIEYSDSECVAEQLGNDGFWKFADAIFADQSKMSADYFVQTAVGLGADKIKFNACVASNKYAGRIDKDAGEATQNGGNGTPYTVIYGKGKQVPVSGALPYEQFMSVINGL